MKNPPQVVLFGSIGGGWREQHIIPVLENGWTRQSGDQAG
jgi:hypothetical protein